MSSESCGNNIKVEIRQGCSGSPLSSQQIEDLVRKVCPEFAVTRATVSLSVVDDREITEINTEFLGHNYSTDVISFDLSDDTKEDSERVFDIIVNCRKAEREAGKLGHSQSSELALYIIHGLLHNLGFDDVTPEQTKEMQKRENRLLEKFGYGNVQRES
jgi:probable rRNA maturation factor